MTTGYEPATAPSLEFRLLGPFEVLWNGAPVPIGGPAERSLLALLLLHAGEAVPAARLIESLWSDDDAFSDRTNALQIRVSKLRRALSGLEGSAPDLVTAPGGYRLDVDRNAVDVHRFASAIAEARDQPSDKAAERALAEALAMWRGSPLVDFASEAWASDEAERLRDLRLSAAEERAAIAIRNGRARAVLDELRRLVDANPLHEALAGLLVRALYLVGRQADALAVYQRIRERLDEELGLEPSPSLRELEAKVLRQDASLGIPEGAEAWSASANADPPRRTASVDAPESRSSRRSRRRLPNRLTSFLGRERELAQLNELVRDSRLVTLLGPGGAGKTSLALEAARSLQPVFPDGVRLVELAELSDSASLLQTFAEAVGVSPELAHGEELLERVLDFLLDRNVLVVLDNCEHLVAQCAHLADAVLRGTDQLRLLVTSREPLGVPGEILYRVEPLSAPPAHERAADKILDYPAVRLFLDRMSAAGGAIGERAVDLELVARLCRELDGLPLGIELAAARTSSMSLEEIAARLTDRFALLNSGPRTADSRQRTLRAAVDWSYELLPMAERTVLRRLSVFRGGCTLSAAEDVVAGEEVAPDAVAGALASLVDRSLLQRSPGSLSRYSLLETVRAYADEQLLAAGERHLLTARHASWVHRLAVESERHLRGPAQQSWLQRLHDELDNVRAALHVTPTGAAGDEIAISTAGHLGWFFHLDRHLEGRAVLERLRDGGQLSAVARASYLQARSILERPRASPVHPDAGCAEFARESAELFEAAGDRYHAGLSRALQAVEGVAVLPRPRADELLTVASDHFSHPSDPWGQAFVDFVRLSIEIAHGNLDTVRRLGAATSASFREIGDSWGRAAVLHHLGVAYRQAGEHSDAIAAFQEAAEVAKPLGLYSIVQSALSGAGVCAVGLDRFELAASFFAQAAETQSEQGDPGGKAQAAHGAGLIARARGDFGSALQWFRTALEGFRAMRTPLSEAAALSGIGRSELSFGRIEEAERAYRELDALAAQANDPLIQAWAWEGRAQLLTHSGDAEAAVRMLQEARSIRREARRPGLAFEDREVAALLESLGAVLPA